MRRILISIVLAVVGWAVLLAAFSGSSAHAQLPEAVDALATGNYPEAIRRLAPLAESGDPIAARLLGGLYLTENDGLKDCPRAIALLEQAAKAGDSRAQYLLGKAYGTGICAPKNFRLALDWYRKAAQQEDPDAAFSVGLYLSGWEGLRADLGEAYFWYIVSVQQFKTLVAERGITGEFPGASNMRSAENNIELLNSKMSASDRQKAERLLSAGSASAFNMRCEVSEVTAGVMVGIGMEPPPPKRSTSLFRIDPRVGRYCRGRCEFLTPLQQVSSKAVIFTDGFRGPPEMGRSWERIDLVSGLYSKREKSALVEVKADGQCSREPFSGFARN